METKIRQAFQYQPINQYQNIILNSIDLVDNNSTKKNDGLLIDSINNQLQMQSSLLDTLELNRECDRLKSFENWDVECIQPSQLALLGFYYLGPQDMVRCKFCRVEIGMWEQDDNVMNEHLRWSPHCPLMTRRTTENIPINPGQLEAMLPPQSIDVCGIRIRPNAVPESSVIREPEIEAFPQFNFAHAQQQAIQQVFLPNMTLNMETTNPLRRPEHPEYAVEARRIKSFEDWPRTIKQKPAQLSDAGFFYTGKGDRVICFSCGGGLKDWEESDDPWEQHATWYSKCEYLKLMKGDLYVKQVFAHKNDENAANAGSSGTHQPPNTEDEAHCSSGSLLHRQGSTSSSDDDLEVRNAKKNEEKLCKICYENEYNTAFTPCGHVIACAKCASSVTKCPSCRQPFTNVMRVYFS